MKDDGLSDLVGRVTDVQVREANSAQGEGKSAPGPGGLSPQEPETRTRTAQIAGTGSYLPGRVVTNRDLRRMVGNFDVDRVRGPLIRKGIDAEHMTEDELFDEWTRSASGILQRHYFDGRATDSGDSEEMAGHAAREALHAAGIQPEVLDFIIVASITPHLVVPNLACTVAHHIGAKRVGGLTLNTACSGFIDGLGDAYYRIRSGEYDTILVVATETLSKITNFNDPSTAMLFGDGAGAAVLRAARSGIVSYYSELDYSRDDIELEERGLLRMDGGPRVARKAINAMSRTALACLERSPYRLDDIDCIVCHQANARIVEGVAKRLGQPLSKFCRTIERFGNTSAASVAIGLDKALRGEVPGCSINRGSRILLTAVGGGYVSSAMVIEYS